MGRLTRCWTPYLLSGIMAIFVMCASAGTATYVSHNLPSEATIGKPYQQVQVTVNSSEYWRGVTNGTLYLTDAMGAYLEKLDYIEKDPGTVWEDNRSFKGNNSDFPHRPPPRNRTQNQTNLADGNETFFFDFTLSDDIVTAEVAYFFIINISFTNPSETKQFRIGAVTAVIGPVADFSWDSSWHGWGPTVGQTLTFSDESREGHADIVSWQWRFGDGSSSSLRQPEHIYNQRGTYTVSLTIEDAQGKNDTYLREITVHGESLLSPLMAMALAIGGGVTMAVVLLWRQRQPQKRP